MSNPPAFEERQRFRGVWFAIPIIALLIVVGLFVWGIYQQLVLGQPWGDEGKQMPDGALAVIGSLVIMVCLVFLWIMVRAELYVAVTDDGLEARLRPLGGGVTKWVDIESATVREYKPIMEFGGWGLRTGKTGKAYTVKGNIGVEMLLSDERTLMIGSQKAEELCAAIQAKIKGDASAS